MSNKQYLRSIDVGDASFEGRQSNGLTAKTDGTTLLYSGVNKSQLEQLETQTDVTNVAINGNVGTIVAIIPAEKNIEYPEGNDNKETTQPTTDPNKITTPTINAGGLNGTYKPLNVLSQSTQDLITKGDGLVLVRETSNSTRVTGTMWFKGQVLGFTCEDPIRTVKIDSKTAIPSGRFNIKLSDTSNNLLFRYRVKVPKDPNNPILNWSANGVFARIGTTSDAVSLKASGLSFGGIRIHGGWSETYSAGCVIYSPKRNKDGTVGTPKVDYWEEHNKKITLLILNNKINHIDIVHEFGSTTTVNITSTTVSAPAPKTTTETVSTKDNNILPPSQEIIIPQESPSDDNEEEKENFTFLDETGIELDPIKVFNVIDVKDNDNEIISDADVAKINQQQIILSNEENKSNPKKTTPTPKPTVKKGSIFKIIQNNSDYGNLGDLYYWPSPLYSQSDPEWGSYKSGDLKQSSHGCCYNTLSMLTAWFTQDATKTPKWHWNTKKNQSVSVYYDRFGTAVNGTVILKEANLASDVDNILKNRPVGFEWKGGKIFSGWGWDKGYNDYHGTIKRSPSGASFKGKKIVTIGISYTASKQHWMVIAGKNQDGTYTVFDPAGGVIRYNQSKETIEAGLSRIVYIK
jgi:hypothetical protein